MLEQHTSLGESKKLGLEMFGCQIGLIKGSDWIGFVLVFANSDLWTCKKYYTSTLPLIATGRSNTPCIPKIADCGGLMIGVPNNEPNTPPFEIVKVPPSISSTANLPPRARPDNRAISRSICK